MKLRHGNRIIVFQSSLYLGGNTGFGFESFEQLGRHRDQDANKPVDDTGVLVGANVDGAFKGVVELGKIRAWL